MNPYSEDELIEKPAINLLAEMGWETLNCYSEFDGSGSPLGRQTKSEVVLTSRLPVALKRLNPTATQDAITKAIEELTRSRSLMSDVEANREIYTFLKDGIRQTPPDPYNTEQVDLSQIDFEQLREQFGTKHKRIEAERLRGAINAKLTSMIRLNRSRMDYQEKFEQMIAEYNAGTLGVQDYFEQLFDFADELHQEDQRAGTKEFSEEELALFDLLTRHEPHLTVPERKEVKTAVRKLLKTLKQEKLVLDWRKRTQSKAEVKETVDNILDDGLPEPYTPELFGQKTEAVYQHIYDAYYGEGKSIYTEN